MMFPHLINRKWGVGRRRGDEGTEAEDEQASPETTPKINVAASAAPT